MNISVLFFNTVLDFGVGLVCCQVEQ